jgi:hypothetical protein
MTLKLPEASGATGSEVKVPVDIEGSKGCGALQFNVTYDPAVLEAKGVEEGGVLSGAMLTCNVAAPGVLKVAVIAQQPLSGDGTLAVVTFRVVGGGNCPLGIDGPRAWEHASNLEMQVAVAPGQFTAGGVRLPMVLIAGICGATLLLVAVATDTRNPSHTLPSVPCSCAAFSRQGLWHTPGLCPKHSGAPH